MTSFRAAALTLARREVTRFLRDRSRVVGALVPPLVFWFLIGSGLGESFRPSGAPDGASYLQYFFPGTVTLIVLFTAVFSTISLIEDRREGFLQAVLVAPVPRSSIAAGKILGGACLGFGHGLLFLALAPAVGFSTTPAGLALALAALGLVALGLTALGFVIAWRLDSTQGFHAIMNLFLIPMWMLSGALFPSAGGPAWLRWVVLLNPMSYGLAALQASLLVSGEPLHPGPGPAACLGVSGAFCLLAFAAAGYVVGRRS